MSEFLTTEALSAFLQVIMIDLVLAGDNVLVAGAAQQRPVILVFRQACRLP